MAYLQDMLLVPWAWRMHTANSMVCPVGNPDGMPAPRVAFSVRTQWTVDWFYILEKLFFQECGRMVKLEKRRPLFELRRGGVQLHWAACLGEKEEESPHWPRSSLGDAEAHSASVLYDTFRESHGFLMK